MTPLRALADAFAAAALGAGGALLIELAMQALDARLWPQ